MRVRHGCGTVMEFGKYPPVLTAEELRALGHPAPELGEGLSRLGFETRPGRTWKVKVCELCGESYWNQWAHAEECRGPSKPSAVTLEAESPTRRTES